MPEPTRRLCHALIERRIHKRAIEVSSRAGQLYRQLGALYANPARRRAVESQLEGAVAKLTGTPVLPGAILIDIPKPEKWRTDVLVSFSRPPIGFEPVMAWRDVAGLADADLKRYEDHRRLIRIVTTADLRDIVRERDLAVRYVGRPERASPSEGTPARHAAEQARIVAEAYEGLAPHDRDAEEAGRRTEIAAAVADRLAS